MAEVDRREAVMVEGRAFLTGGDLLLAVAVVRLGVVEHLQ